MVWWLVAEAFVQNFRLKTTVDGEIQAQKYAERTPERSEGALKEDVYFATTPFWWWWLVVVVGGWWWWLVVVVGGGLEGGER